MPLYVPAGSVAPALHAASHGAGQTDAVTVALSQVSDAGTMAAEDAGSYAPSSHAASHGAGQADAITVALSQVSDAGTMAAEDTSSYAPSTHAASHGAGQSDAVTVALSQVSDAGTMAAEDAADYTPTVESVNVVGASGASQILPDPSVSSVSDVTLTVSCEFTMPAVAAAGTSVSCMVVLEQGGSGSYTPTFTGATWPSGTAPSWSTAVGAIDHVMFSSTNGRAWVGAALIGVAAP